MSDARQKDPVLLMQRAADCVGRKHLTPRMQRRYVKNVKRFMKKLDSFDDDE